MESHFGLKNVALPTSIAQALKDLNFTSPTPVQAQTIPLAVTGRDLIACAQTGTGKTAAFSIPTLMHLLKHPHATALVLAPTRELVLQIDAFWKKLTAHTPQMKSAVLIGGAGMNPQIHALRARPRLILATPGRLIDHLQRRTAHLSHVAILVLDEADRMLDMGFAPQVEKILRHVPTQRQTLLFSATFAKEAEDLARRALKNPERINVGTVSQAAPKVEQKFIRAKQTDKNKLLFDQIVDGPRDASTIIFTRTQARTDRLARYLTQGGLTVDRIHGGRTQGQRTRALQSFREGTLRILVATEIAARGIDVPAVARVINFDLPQVAEDYIHRIGRTARAGASGQALSFVTPEEHTQWREILGLLKKSGSALPEEISVSGSLGQDAPAPSQEVASMRHPHPASRKAHRHQRRHGRAPRGQTQPNAQTR